MTRAAMDRRASAPRLPASVGGCRAVWLAGLLLAAIAAGWADPERSAAAATVTHAPATPVAVEPAAAAELPRASAVSLEAEFTPLAVSVSRRVSMRGRMAHKSHLRPAHDLRKPRPPRHRSERPSTGLAMVGDVLIERLLEFLDAPLASRFVGTPPDSVPLAGHPLQLLRPPAARG